MITLIALDVADLAIAAGLLLIDAALSISLRLRLEGKLPIAALRIVTQLLLIGLVLKGLFALTSPLRSGVAVLIMISFAGWEGIGAPRKLFLWQLGIRTWHHGDDDCFNSGHRLCTDEAGSARPLVRPAIRHSYAWHDSRQYNDWRQSRPRWPVDRRMAESTQHRGAPRAWRQQEVSNASNFPGRDG